MKKYTQKQAAEDLIDIYNKYCKGLYSHCEMRVYMIDILMQFTDEQQRKIEKKVDKILSGV